VTYSPYLRYLAAAEPDGHRVTVGPLVTPPATSRLRTQLAQAGFTDITEFAPGYNEIPTMTVVDFRRRYDMPRSAT
jgi:hypothetical protein